MDKFLEIAGFIIGLLYLWWEYHADAKLWIASIIMPSISIWLYFDKGLYADFAINIYYWLIAVYGYWAWTRKDNGGGKKEESKNTGLPITHAGIAVLGLCAAATGAIWWLIWYVLSHFTNSTVPVADAFTTALSIVAMWMLARKYIEQWIAWMIADAVCVGLYIYKEIPLYATLYLIYTIIAVFGYRKWAKAVRTER